MVFRGKNIRYSLIALLACVMLSSCNNSTTTQTSAEQSNVIDLGLSVLWADRNIGADSPSDYGDYFAWGETTPKNTYSWDNYKYCKSGELSINTDLPLITKYCAENDCGIVDNKKILEPEDDAATQNWGNGWRMPTLDEYMELIMNCDGKWTERDGIKGCEFTSKKNGNKVFFPAAGRKDEKSLSDTASVGLYWTACIYETPSYLSSLISSDAYTPPCLNFNHNDAIRGYLFGRSCGLPVRAVRSKN